MNRKRMVSYSIILTLLILSLLFGAFTLIMSEAYKRNTVSFKVGDSGAYCKVDAQHFMGETAISSNRPTSMFEDSYTEVEEYSKNGKTLSGWLLGDTAFVVDENDDGTPTENDIDIMVFKIRITNLNAEKALGINLSGVAWCNIDDEDSNYFSTKIIYQVNGGEEVIKYSNEDDATVDQKSGFDLSNRVVNDITGEIIQVDGYLDITITFKRRTKTDSFEVKNNIVFEMFVDEN